ncbi:MAG: hypothetical protein U0894_17350 [Pirellulales bacterium]
MKKYPSIALECGDIRRRDRLFGISRPPRKNVFGALVEGEKNWGQLLLAGLDGADGRAG